MDKLKVGKALMISGAILMGVCFWGLLAGPNGDHAAVFWCAVAAEIIGLVLCVTGFMIAWCPRYARPKNRQRYLSYAPDILIDCQAELETVRANFRADPDPKKNRIAVEAFENSAPHYDFSVIEKGKIYYAYLVEANRLLFEDKKFAMLTHPAVVLYSTEEYFEKNPTALKKLARYMFDNRNKKGWAGKILSNETFYFSNLQVPPELADGHEIFMTTIMIYRRHLPLGYLTNSLLPIIANPLQSSAVFVVDVKYWTEALIGNFVHDYEVKGEEIFDNLK